MKPEHIRSCPNIIEDVQKICRGMGTIAFLAVKTQKLLLGLDNGVMMTQIRRFFTLKFEFW